MPTDTQPTTSELSRSKPGGSVRLLFVGDETGTVTLYERQQVKKHWSRSFKGRIGTLDPSENDAFLAVAVGGDFLPMGRFLVPAFAPLALLGGGALAQLAGGLLQVVAVAGEVSLGQRQSALAGQSVEAGLVAQLLERR